MRSSNMNLENAQEWHEAGEEDYLTRLDIDQDLGEMDRFGNKSAARLRIEELKERKQLDELLYDVFNDSDSIM